MSTFGPPHGLSVAAHAEDATGDAELREWHTPQPRLDQGGALTAVGICSGCRTQSRVDPVEGADGGRKKSERCEATYI